MVPLSPVSCNQRPQRANSPSRQIASSLPCTLEKEPSACLYSAMQRAENKVGGGEGLEGVYGSITRAGMTRVLETLQQHAQLNEDSIMLDIGSGLGRPLMHAIVHANVAATYGIEVDAVKCQKAVPFIRHVVTELESLGIVVPADSQPKFICTPIEEVPSLEPATHVYAAWEGFARSAMQAVGKLFSASHTAKAITIVQRSFRQKDEAEEMEALGFGPVKLVGSAAVYMAGSRRRLNAYTFVRDPLPSGACLGASNLSTMPAFTPDSVSDVLALQAEHRAAAKAGKAEQSGEAALQDTCNDRDKAPGQTSKAPAAAGSNLPACEAGKSSARSERSDLASRLGKYNLRSRG